MATVGRSTRSITRLNGSVTPVDSNARAASISASNLEKRSLNASSRLELFDRVDQLPDGLDLGLLVHGDEDVELVLDVGDEIEHGQAVPLEVLGEARRPSVTSTPFLLNGSIRAFTLASVWSRSVMAAS